MARKKSSKTTAKKTRKTKNQKVKLNEVIPIDWKILLAFLLGIVITVLYFSVTTADSSIIGDTTNGSTETVILSDALTTLVIVEDSTCPICDSSWIPDRVGLDFYNVTVSYVDINSEQGQEYADELSLTSVPAAFFADGFEETGNYSLYTESGWVSKIGDYYVLNIMGEKSLLREESNTPSVEIFVMSHCPYGTAAESTMSNILDTITDFDFGIHFIGNVYTESEWGNLPENYVSYYETYDMCEQKNDSKYYCSLHGPSEVEGDIAQLCVMKYYEDWFDFVLAYNEDFSVEDSISTMDYNETLIDNCINSEEGRDLYSEDIAIADELGMGSSPTYLFDNVIIGTGAASFMQNGPASALCSLHSDIEGCEDVEQIETTQSTGSC